MRGTDDLIHEHEAVLVALRVLEKVVATRGALGYKPHCSGYH